MNAGLDATRLGAGREIDADNVGDDAVVTVHSLNTADGASVSGVLYRPRGATTVVTISHPRTDVTHHPMVAHLVRKGVAVWTQGTRSVGNDLNLVHEQAIVDLAAGFVFLGEVGFDQVIPLGHSGGGALFAFYIQQASLPSSARIATTPGGRDTGLADVDMPVPNGLLLLAPHPGQGELLLNCVDPSVTDENDPLSVDPDLDPFNPANGFHEPPDSAAYDDDFVERYRAAQRVRVARIDERARRLVDAAAAERAEFTSTGSIAARRRSLAPKIITVYRTDADLRCVDLHLDPSERPYGSLFGRRPDITNYGLVGFGRLNTPDAWLSTWSGLSTNAGFRQCGPWVTVPTLLIEFTGDQSAFPAVTDAIFDSIASDDKTRAAVPSRHFGAPLENGGPTGPELATPIVADWLALR